jgi:hypothetical protein
MNLLPLPRWPVAVPKRPLATVLEPSGWGVGSACRVACPLQTGGVAGRRRQAQAELRLRAQEADAARRRREADAVRARIQTRREELWPRMYVKPSTAEMLALSEDSLVVHQFQDAETYRSAAARFTSTGSALSRTK